ncbi:hypothetical protein GCM10027451_42980 [Geodermatophilus aquaeductus]|uniref:Uncharacterized protein n=1 Tax=Geodermatophilus aquaeductus TaxID=1564161 RepID=A0A521FQL9_9ACTN|nr:hypothetical protein [Geodermatophilus aquaeductus]SMO98488.1 hypothetical protein SAMN06273567_11369 [Geodermatophilus aquaeductus]
MAPVPCWPPGATVGDGAGAGALGVVVRCVVVDGAVVDGAVADVELPAAGRLGDAVAVDGAGVVGAGVDCEGRAGGTVFTVLLWLGRA